MWWKRALVGGVVAGAMAAGLFFGGVLGGEGASESAPQLAAQPSQALAIASYGFALQDSASLVARLQERLRSSPQDVEALGLLGLAYQQRARETGDPTWYTKAEGVLENALELAPDDLV